MLYCTPNRHLKVCRKILWFPCFLCFTWPRKLEKTNENKKNKKARKCHTLISMKFLCDDLLRFESDDGFAIVSKRFNGLH